MRHPSQDVDLGEKGVGASFRGGDDDFETPLRRRKIAPVEEDDAEWLNVYAPPTDFESKHNMANHIFGISPWMKYVTKGDVDAQFDAGFSRGPDHLYSIGNLMWTLFFGSWLFVLYLVVSLLLFVSVVGIKYGWLCYNLAFYFLWPFGKTLEKLPDHQHSEERHPVMAPSGFSTSGPVKQPQNTPHWHPALEVAGFAIFTGLFGPILFVAHCTVAFFCWMSMYMIPMAKLNFVVAKDFFNSPLKMMVSGGSPSVNVNIVMYTLQAGSRRYLSYSVGGMSVWLVNLIPFVALTVLLGYVFPHIPGLESLADPIIIFCCSLLSIVPIAFIMGMAISSVASQSTLAVGAVLNATFGTIVELILYLQLIAGGFSTIVRSGITGALLVCLILMPGASMVAGGVKHKHLRINARSAGVTSVLLVISIIGAFCPTIYYEIYGSYDLECHACVNLTVNGLHCGGCQYKEVDMDRDPVYLDRARPLMYICAGIMPFAYFAALLFTLRTHAHIYDVAIGEDDEHKGGHDAPAWSTKKCILILVLCTALFALVSEKLVSSMEPVLELLGLDEVFVGLTVIALVTNFAEFVNAVQFSMHNNMELALEISSAAAVQTTLIIMPVLVVASAIINHFTYEHSFTLIFPALNLSAVFFAFLIYYINSISGSTNYFNGVAFIIIYFLLVVMFYYVPSEEE